MFYIGSSCPNVEDKGLYKGVKILFSLHEVFLNFSCVIFLFSFCRLDIQHRMHPAISKLIVPHIYEGLLDHPSVLDYPEIKGVASNVFFLNHNEKETKIQDGNSKTNLHEVEFLTELCRYFLKQGKD